MSPATTAACDCAQYVTAPSDTAVIMRRSDCRAKCLWWNLTSGYVSLASGVAGLDIVKISYLRSVKQISCEVEGQPVEVDETKRLTTGMSCCVLLTITFVSALHDSPHRVVGLVPLHCETLLAHQLVPPRR